MTIQPDKKYLSVLRIRLFLCALLPVFACGVLFTFFPTAGILTGVVLLCAFLWGWFWYLPRFFRSCRVVLSPCAVAVHRGVFLRRKYILPSPRTIYAEEIRTPIASLFGLRAVNIHLVRRILPIDGLSEPDARRVLSHLPGGVAHE